jgi:hypothetical protein
VFAAIFLHNMMVEACLENREVECASMYNTLATIVEEN